eukprot:TRINITY_DN10491_c0_g1_i1.p1 TRINITY_DN10491_c0_g1~~TRINITY_DN10491_c0_g1_i1.p1  ORF type:complete len:718 (+),score=120.61 TRINITY_DN10491_c0_g1_i1:118-2271(+)
MEDDYQDTRSKLYKLNDGEWVPIGVGHATIEIHDGGGGRLLLIDEDDPRNLLIVHNLEVGMAQSYQKQQDTLILFTNQQTQEEFGLSFEGAAGCSLIWKGIIHVVSSPMEAEDEFQPLPAITRENLPYISDLLEEATLPTRDTIIREAYSKQIIDDSLIEQFFEVFNESEEHMDMNSLHLIWKIFKTLFVFANQGLTRLLLSPKYIRDVIACFEYNPMRPGKRANHRKALDGAMFKNPLGLDKGLAEKIKKIHHMQYLKDSVLAAFLDDQVFECHIVVSKNAILRSIIYDSAGMENVFQILGGEKAHAPENANDVLCVLQLLQELAAAAKTLPLSHRSDFLENLQNRGLFSVIAPFISHPNDGIRAAVADISLHFAILDVNLIRDFSVREGEQMACCPLLRGAFYQVVHETIEGLQQQWQDVVRLIIETQVQKAQFAFAGGPAPPTMPAGFITLLYEPLPPNATDRSQQMKPIVEILFEPILYHRKNYAGDPNLIPPESRCFYENSALADEVAYVVLPLLSSCVAGHPARMNCALLANKIPKKVTNIISIPPSPKKHLYLSVVWFVRSLVTSDDEMMSRHIVSEDLLSIVFSLLAKSTRYNLLNSSLLSVLENISNQNCRTLTKYVVSKYADDLKAIDYVATGSMIVTKEQSEGMKATKRLSAGMEINNPFAAKLDDTDCDDFDDDVETPILPAGDEKRARYNNDPNYNENDADMPA